jgi:hypothetical protein
VENHHIADIAIGDLLDFVMNMKQIFAMKDEIAEVSSTYSSELTRQKPKIPPLG